MPDLKSLHDEYRRAIEATRAAENGPADVFRAASRRAQNARLALDEALIDSSAEADRLAMAEGRDAAARANFGAGLPPERDETRERFLAWEANGRPGTFRVAVMPDLESDLRSAGNERARVSMEHRDYRPQLDDGTDWTQFAPQRESRAAILTSDASTVYSSYIAPARTQQSLAWHMNAQSGIVKAGPTIVQTPDMTTLYLPKFATDAAATHHNEGEASSESNPVLGRLDLEGYRYDGYFSVSTEQLRSSIIDVTAMLQEAASRAIATAVAAAYATGSGSNLPQGLAGSATTTVAGVTAASATTFTFDNLVTLKHSLLPGWRNNGSWAFGSNALAYLTTLKDGQGQYVWEPRAQAGTPDMLLGFPVFEDADVPDITSGTKGAVLFGDFSQFVIRLAGPMVFEASDHWQFEKHLTTMRYACWTDSDLLFTDSIKHMLMAT